MLFHQLSLFCSCIDLGSLISSLTAFVHARVLLLQLEIGALREGCGSLFGSYPTFEMPQPASTTGVSPQKNNKLTFLIAFMSLPCLNLEVKLVPLAISATKRVQHCISPAIPRLHMIPIASFASDKNTPAIVSCMTVLFP